MIRLAIRLVVCTAFVAALFLGHAYWMSIRDEADPFRSKPNPLGYIMHWVEWPGSRIAAKVSVIPHKPFTDLQFVDRPGFVAIQITVNSVLYGLALFGLTFFFKRTTIASDSPSAA